MTDLRYTANIITKTREYTGEELAWIEKFKQEHPVESTITMERLLWMDDNFVKNASMYMECIWLWNGETKSGLMEEPHVHDFDEVIGFISSDPDNPKELGAVMEMNMGDEVHYLKNSCLMHIPAGMKHCPLTFQKVDRPVFFFTLAPIGNYGRTSGIEDKEAYEKTPFAIPEPDESGTKYNRYIITEPKPHGPPPSGEPRPKPAAKTSHIVSLDDSVSPGAFYVDFVWIWSGDLTMAPKAHSHDWDEMIGFASAGTKENPRKIEGDITIDIDGEEYPITQSSLVYLPGGVDHCPIEFKNIKKPVLLFTIGNTTTYTSSLKK